MVVSCGCDCSFMGSIGIGCGVGLGGFMISFIGIGLFSISLFLFSLGTTNGGTVSSWGFCIAGSVSVIIIIYLRFGLCFLIMVFLITLSVIASQ